MKNVIIKCPNCENETEILPGDVGSQIRCPRCSSDFWAKKSLIVTKANIPICIIAGLIFSFFGALIAGLSYGKEGAKWSFVGIIAGCVFWIIIGLILQAT